MMTCKLQGGCQDGGVQKGRLTEIEAVASCLDRTVSLAPGTVGLLHTDGVWLGVVSLEVAIFDLFTVFR